MKWADMQKPLARGFQAYRLQWPEDRYVEQTEGGRNQIFWESNGSYLESAFEPSPEELEGEDWQATGPGGD